MIRTQKAKHGGAMKVLKNGREEKKRRERRRRLPSTTNHRLVSLSSLGWALTATASTHSFYESQTT